jgi:hypothetical protein
MINSGSKFPFGNFSPFIFRLFPPNFYFHFLHVARYIITIMSKNKDVKGLVRDMDKTLGYLRETLANYNDEHTIGSHLYRKLAEGQFSSEGSFVKHLNQTEINFLNKILPNEIRYAKEEQDEKRAHELNEVFELLF